MMAELSIEETAMEPQAFLKKYYPGGFYGYDRDGRPVFWEPLGQVDFWGILHSVKSEEVMKYKRGHCEMAKSICGEQEKKLDKTLEQYSTLVLDAHGGGRKHLWKPGLDLFKATIQMYDQDYPTLRKRIVVIRTPAIFPVLFSLVKPFLREETKNKIKVVGSNWKEYLQKHIEADQIPVYYGGTAVDENGNEKCEQHIGYGGEVPTSFYTSEKVKQAEFKSTVIKAGNKMEIEVEVTAADSKITYQFVTSDFDIEFSVSLKPKDSDEVIQVIEKSRKQSHILMEEGVIEGAKEGVYVFQFNNAYSWIRDKELFYNIRNDQNGGETQTVEKSSKSIDEPVYEEINEISKD